MTMTRPNMTDVATIPRLGHREAMVLAENEFSRTLQLLRGLRLDDWQRPTICELWDVRAMVAHMLGMAEAQASFRQFIHDARAANRRTGGSMIDAMTATQVRDRADLSPAQLIERFVAVVPRAVRARRRVPAPIRSAVRIKQDPPFDAHRWQYGYLVDTIFTRDPWIHRLDISRATGRDMTLTDEHDGRLVADVVGEWSRRHGEPFTLILTGPAGGQWRAGSNGEHIEVDALDFCWTLARRTPRPGLLSTPVPF
ncbi:MAG: maleylpyruvate isomerase family mycothiol-dependent enzyme [Candidatus Dormibacteria bacterium]